MLWTDLIDPATLTGYVRSSLEDYEASKGTLARWLPNRTIADQVVRLTVGSSGLLPEARYRAFDAEPEIAKTSGGRRITFDLPALSQEKVVSEYAQLRARNAPDSQIRDVILRTAAETARAIADRTERMRGTVLATGKATINQDNYLADADFGRDADLTTTAPESFLSEDADAMGYLETLVELYTDRNNEAPGAFVGPRRVMSVLRKNKQFATLLVNGSSRPATNAEVASQIEGAGLPAFFQYDRKTSGGLVLPSDTIMLLPAPVDTDDRQGTQLGATFVGQTLTASDPTYGIAATEQPGIVSGTYRNPKPPMIAEVISDSLIMPALANGNLSIAAKVLY